MPPFPPSKHCPSVEQDSGHEIGLQATTIGLPRCAGQCQEVASMTWVELRRELSAGVWCRVSQRGTLMWQP